MELGSQVGKHGQQQTFDMGRASMDVLLAAFGHVEARLERCSDARRGRKQAQWLGKWQRRICAEIDRRNNAKDLLP
jgi:hypothetical protein